MIPVSTILVAVQAGTIAFRYGRAVDSLMTQKELTAAGIALPLPADFSGNLTQAEITEELDAIGVDPGVPLEIRRSAKRLASSIEEEERINFLREVRPTAFLDAEKRQALMDSARKLQLVDGKDGVTLDGVILLLGDDSAASGIRQELANLTKDFLVGLASTAAPTFIKGQGGLVIAEAALRSFGETNVTGDGIADWSRSLLKAALNSTLTAVANNPGSIKVEEKSLKAAFGLFEEIHNGFDNDEDWFNYAERLMDGEKTSKFIGAILGATSKQITPADDEHLKKFVKEYGTFLAGRLREADQPLQQFLRAGWPEILGGALESFSQHDIGILKSGKGLGMVAVQQLTMDLGKAAVAHDIDGWEDILGIGVKSVAGAVVENAGLLEGHIDEASLRCLITSVVEPLGKNLLDTSEARQAAFGGVAKTLLSGTFKALANEPGLMAKLAGKDGDAFLKFVSTELAATFGGVEPVSLSQRDSLGTIATSLAAASLHHLGTLGGDAAGSPLKALIAGIADPLKSATVNRLVNQDDLFALLATAAKQAASDPRLSKSFGPEGNVMLADIVSGIFSGIETSPPEARGGEIAKALLTSMTDWAVKRPETGYYNLEPFVRGLSAQLGQSLDEGRLNPAAITASIDMATRALLNRPDSNFLLQPEALGWALAGVRDFAEKDFPEDQRLLAVGRLAAHLLAASPTAIREPQALAGLNPGSLKVAIGNAVVAGLTGTFHDLRAAYGVDLSKIPPPVLLSSFLTVLDQQFSSRLAASRFIDPSLV